jgi:hypothetical protein
LNLNFYFRKFKLLFLLVFIFKFCNQRMSKKSYCSIESYSKVITIFFKKKKYGDLFNKETGSDIDIVFEKSGDKIKGKFYFLKIAHKVILYSGCTYFEDLITNGEITNNEIMISKDVNQKHFENIIKFIYSGSYEYKDESEVVMFVIMANKVKKLK